MQSDPLDAATGAGGHPMKPVSARVRLVVEGGEDE